MSEARSDSPTKCGLCGGEAFSPERFSGEDTGGLFNVCGECGAECSRTGAYTETDRYYWTGARQVAQAREAMAAMELDAEMGDAQRYDY